jgi:hypothetical protein
MALEGQQAHVSGGIVVMFRRGHGPEGLGCRWRCPGMEFPSARKNVRCA